MDTAERRERIFEAWDLLGEKELLPFHKLLTGGFRMGVSKGNLCKALARVGNVEARNYCPELGGFLVP